MNRIVYEKGGQTVVNGDCLEVMDTLKAGEYSLVFADPPYNLQLSRDLIRPEGGKVAGVCEAWDRFDDFESYDRFSADWITKAGRLLKDDGSLWVIGSYHNIFRLGRLLQDLGWWILNDVVWIKSNPLPNLRGRRFCNAHETLLWCVKSKAARYDFNYRSLKEMNDGRQMRSDWYLPIAGRKERILGDDAKSAHPTQKPEALLRRIMLASGRRGDLVLDPFGGSGTTAAAARRLGRRSLLIERDPKYCEVIAKRLDKVREFDEAGLEQAEEPRRQSRIPFASLIENGLIEPGETVENKDRKIRARVTVDGRLVCGQNFGSIHKLASEISGAPENGWHFWQISKTGIPLDELRRTLRSRRATA